MNCHSGQFKIVPPAFGLALLTATFVAGCSRDSGTSTEERSVAIPTVRQDLEVESPALSVDSEVLDLGSVELHEPLCYSIRIRHNHTVPVTIRRIIPGCACTDVKIDNPTINPNHEATVNIVVSSSVLGARSSVINFVPDQGVNPISVQIKWHVKSKLVLSHETISFGTVQRGVLAKQKITISQNPEFAFATGQPVLESVSLKPRGELSAEHSNTDRGIELTVELLPNSDSASLSTTKGSMSVKISGVENPLVIPVSWEAVDTVFAAPESFSLGVTEPSKPWKRRLVVKSLLSPIVSVQPLEQGMVDVKDLSEPNSTPTTRIMEIEGITPVTQGVFSEQVKLTVVTQDTQRVLNVTIAGYVR